MKLRVVMQHVTYMGGTIRLRGKLAVSRGNLILVPYPPNIMRVTEYQPHTSQSNFLPIRKTTNVLATDLLVNI